MTDSVINKWAIAYDPDCKDINHGVMATNNRLLTNAARLEGIKLEAPTELHTIRISELENFAKKLDAENYNLLLFVDSLKKKDENNHEKIKHVSSQCESLRIQHVLYKSISKNAADNIRRCVVESLKKMGQPTVSE